MRQTPHNAASLILDGPEALTNYQPTNPITPVAISNATPFLIGQLLRRDPTAVIDSINLSNQPVIGHDQIEELVDVLKSYKNAASSIKAINLSNMNLSAASEITKDGFREVLRSLLNLESLNLSGNNMGKGDIGTLLGSLRNCQNLYHLDLRGNANEYLAQNQDEVAAIIRPIAARAVERAPEIMNSLAVGLAASRGMPRPRDDRPSSRPRPRGNRDSSGRERGGDGGMGR